MVHALELSYVAGSFGYPFHMRVRAARCCFERLLMNAPVNNQLEAALHHVTALQGSADNACARIAPTWPLDQFIAVNPYWGWVGKPFGDAAAELARLSGTSL